MIDCTLYEYTQQEVKDVVDNNTRYKLADELEDKLIKGIFGPPYLQVGTNNKNQVYLIYTGPDNGGYDSCDWIRVFETKEEITKFIKEVMETILNLGIV